MKLLMTDLDGTLFDTKKVNYLAYQEAIKKYGYNLDFEYYSANCNGRHYLDFLPELTTSDIEILKKIHTDKKRLYKKYLDYARINTILLEMLYCLKEGSKIALVTTASKENTYEILQHFEIEELFDLILTHEDVKREKPDPEGYLRVMKYFGVSACDAVIFEDSDIGVEAAQSAGVQCFVVKGYN